MHWEQSRVGKVSESWAMWPPIDGWRSTRITGYPLLAISRAAWIPETPPPITRAFLVTSTLMVSKGLSPRTFSTMVRTILMALLVARALSS